MPTAVGEEASATDAHVELINPNGLKITLARADEHGKQAAKGLRSCDDSHAKFSAHLSKHSLSQLRVRPTISSNLRAGLQFSGTQQSGRAIYDVNVSFKYVDLVDSFLCGFLRISGLSEDHPTLTTYFEGEIIGSKYSFITKNPNWNSSEKIDIEHWARFAAFRPIAQNLRNARSSQKTSQTSEEATRGHDHVFMRWKELHILPNEHANGVQPGEGTRDRPPARSLEGVSYAGFYYICLDQRNGSINGMYYHQNSELYQQLHLTLVPDSGRRFNTFEWR